MTWTATKTWVTGELVTAAMLNTYISGNDDYLKSRVPNYGIDILDEGADITTTNTTFTDIGSSALSVTITVNYGVAMIGFYGTFYNSTAGAGVYLEVDIDGVAHATNDGLMLTFFETSALARTMSFVTIAESLSVASHTFKMRWKVSAGTGTIYAGAGTGGADVHPMLWVQEVIQ